MSKMVEIESPIVKVGRMIGPKSLPAIAALLGAMVFGTIMGITMINPGNLGWLVSSDASTGYLGWFFFRLAPWAWPPGALHSSGLDHVGSLIAADSIPLLALFFKLFDRLLPSNFQYVGLWLLACYVLQGFFAYRLLALFTGRIAVLLGGVLLFLLSPILLVRSQANPALAAHWLVLAALYLYYANADHRRPMAWLVLLWLATLVQEYLALMVLVIWLAHLFQCRKAGDKLVASIVVAVAGTAALMWLAGYFVLPFVSTVRFGFNSMNGLAPFLPLGEGPFRVHAAAMATPGQFEGFNYLGLGVLAALVVAIATSRHSRKEYSETAWVTTPDKSLVLACIVLTALALSNVVTWGSHRLFTVPLGELSSSGMNVIGASGRLFWPAYYLLILAALRGLLRLPTRLIGIAMLVVVVLQLVDLMPYLHATQRESAERMQDEGFPSADSLFWRLARTRYTHFHLVAANANARLINDYRYVAGLQGFVIDPLNYADMSFALAETRQQDLEFSLGHFEPDSIYLVPFDTLQKLQKDTALFPARTGMGIVDGLAIVAPGWFETAAPDYLHHRGYVDQPPVALNRTVSFAKNGKGRLFIASGWSAPEDEGFWSDGSSSSLAFQAPDVAGDLRMVFDVLPYLPAQFPRLGVDVRINGKWAAHWSFDTSRPKPLTTLMITSALLAHNKNLSVSFAFDSPRSPQEAGVAADPRKLALFIRTMRLQLAKSTINISDSSD